jgi:transposase
MLKFMDRSTIHNLKRKGYTNVEIADWVQCHRDTVAKVLREPLDKEPAPRPRASQVAVFHAQIEQWLDDKLSVQRMLELARADPEHPYQGSDPAFYAYVRPLRRARRARPADVPVRFAGLPGELLQIDWGEVRRFPFTQPDLDGQTRYFFAARLKYSRWMFVQFTTDMREETLLRCLIACFCALGGVPWVVTTDNMKTVTYGRDDQHQPLWTPAFQKLAVEFGFHPDACAVRMPQQKGSVENLVKFVKGHFLAGRQFVDDADLAQSCQQWLHQVNELRPSDATEQLPVTLLAEERARFGALPPQAADYGFLDLVKVTRESVVRLATNGYSVPVQYVGQTLTARIHPQRIVLYHNEVLVAEHPRLTGRNQRRIEPAHFEPVFAAKPRARVMVYRDWLVALAPEVAAYVSEVCRRRYHELAAQMTALYDLAQQVGQPEFSAAVALASEQQVFGAEYVQAITQAPQEMAAASPGLPEALQRQVAAQPAQTEVERDLAQYERYVANRQALGVAVGGAA